MQEASYVVMRNGIKRQPPPVIDRERKEGERKEDGKRSGVRRKQADKQQHYFKLRT